MKKIIVNVTARDIKYGRNHIHDGQNCPIARSLKRHGNFFHGKHVEREALSQDRPPFLRLALWPEEAVQFQTRIINGERVKPFKFVVEVK